MSRWRDRWLAASFALFVFTVVLTGCSGGGSPPDAGPGDGREGGDPGETGDDGNPLSDDGWSPADEREGDSFAIVIRSGTKACTIFAREDVYVEYRLHGRITFRPGTYLLPLDRDSVTLDWIEGIELGPERAVPTPKGAGVFTRTFEGTGSTGIYHYQFRREYDASGQPFTVLFQRDFAIENGTPVADTVTFDEQTLSDYLFVLNGVFGDGADPTNQLQRYTTCEYSLFRKTVLDFNILGGDTLALDHVLYNPGMMACKLCPAALTRVVFKSGTETREVSDFFRLSHTAGHHNWDQQFLVVFDQPVGSVYGLHLKDEPFGARPKEIHYLNANLQTIETKAILNGKPAP